MNSKKEFFKSLLGRPDEPRDQLSKKDTKRGNNNRALTLDPSGATVILLAPSIKPHDNQHSRWPEGFWDAFNTASNLYRQGRYSKAKDGYMTARSLKNNYLPLNIALIRTFRKLYKSAIEKKHWAEAFRELAELIRTFPDDITDIDRKQFNKTLEAMKITDPNISEQPLAMNIDKGTKKKIAEVLVERPPDSNIAVQHDNSYQRPKGERPCRWQERCCSSKGFIAMQRIYNKQEPSEHKWRIWMYSPEGDLVSQNDLPNDFHRLKISSSADRMIGYSENMILSVWTLNGEKLAERDIMREEDNDKYHIRCVDLSEDYDAFLFTSATTAYLLDQQLRNFCVLTMPPPEGYHVEHRSQSEDNKQLEMALAVLEMSGTPTQEEIKAQFRRLALRYHPDQNPGDETTQERMKDIILAYKLVSREDALLALEGLVTKDYYYKIVEEKLMQIPNTGISITFTVSISGGGDWIYSSHIEPHAERIYLGCYSGRIYCIDKIGKVLKIYSTDAPIDFIIERQGIIYIRTCTSLYVLQDDRTTNLIDLRVGSFECFAEWGFIINKKNVS